MFEDMYMLVSETEKTTIVNDMKCFMNKRYATENENTGRDVEL